MLLQCAARPPLLELEPEPVSALGTCRLWEADAGAGVASVSQAGVSAWQEAACSQSCPPGAQHSPQASACLQDAPRQRGPMLTSPRQVACTPCTWPLGHRDAFLLTGLPPTTCAQPSCHVPRVHVLHTSTEAVLARHSPAPGPCSICTCVWKQPTCVTPALHTPCLCLLEGSMPPVSQHWGTPGMPSKDGPDRNGTSPGQPALGNLS